MKKMRFCACPSLVVAMLAAWLLAPLDASAQPLRRTSTSVAGAIARYIDAEAASKEMDNEIKWVNTYFERRKLNREWRAKEHPGYLDRLEKQKETYRRLLDTNLAALGGDKSEELNWMLREILANASYSILMSDSSGKLISSGHNAALSEDQRRQIWVTEGKIAGKKSLVLRVVDPRPLETRWPLALREERCDQVCKAFEEARDLALADLASKEAGREVTREHRKRLMKAVNALAEEVAAEYRERPKPVPPQDFLTYKTAKCFVESLAVQTFRMFETESTAAYDGSFRFEGKTVGELLQHMMSKGLQFAPARPGGEPTYELLYNSVRGFYLDLVPKAAAEK
jgi:hypothetical protein